MQYKQLGKTGESVSVIGFGGMRFKKSEYGKGDLDKCAEIPLRARELGVNYFDTSPGYCDDVSEDVLARAFKRMKEKPLVSTKCGLWMATDADGARRRVEKSLKRMGLEKIDFYHMWCAKTWEEYQQMTRPGGIYDGLLKAKEEGLIGHICCSTHMIGDDIARLAADGRVESVTLGYNALNFAYRQTGVKACHDAGVGVVVMNPLGGGVIPQNGELFGFIKRTPDEPIVGAALRFLLGQKEVNVALVGASSVREMEECAAAGAGEAVVGETDLERVRRALNEELNTLCTGCAYCDECPEGVPIPILMESFNQYLLKGGSIEAARARVRDHWGRSAGDAKACTECGQCESLCTQKLPIMKRLKMLGG